MKEFCININQVGQLEGRLIEIKSSVKTVRDVVSNSMDGLSSIGLGALVPKLKELDSSLSKCGGTINVLSNRTRDIVNRYYRAETNLLANVKTTPKTDKAITKNTMSNPLETNIFDVNGDGKVDWKDALAFLKNKFDINGDGKVDLNDVLALFEQVKQAGFESVYYEDENGQIHYDMDAIEWVLGLDPDDVPDEVYDRIALAYTCMDAEEVETMMLAMMEKEKDVDYPWYNEFFGPWAGQQNEDYTSWVLNDDVYDEMSKAMSRLAQGNLSMINYCDQMYSETGDSSWLDAARSGVEYRDILVQREAMLNAIGNIEDFHGRFEGDRPNFDVDQKSDGTFVIEFEEWRNVGTSGSPVFSNFGESTITIDPCLDGATFAIQNTETVELMLHNQFASGFDSSGFESDEACAQFWVEHLLGYGCSNVENAVINALPDGVSTGVGYVDIAVNALSDGVMDYYQGTQNAAFIEGVGDYLQASEIYQTFGCDVVSVHYDACDMHETALYVEEGRYTNQRIDYYNNNFDTPSITANDLIHDPVNVCEDMIDLIEEGESFEDLACTTSWHK